MKAKLHLLLLLLFPLCVTYSQVSIGHTAPAASAALDVSAVGPDGVTVLSKGFLVPRMTTAERDAIENPATGLIIYNTETNCNEYYQGTGNSWFNFCASSGDGGFSSNGTAIVSGYDCQNGKDAAMTGHLTAEAPLLGNVTHKIIATVAKGGEYNLSAAVNGIVFAAKGSFAEPDPTDPTTSVQEVTLKGTGTPIAKGVYTFNLNTVPDCYFNREVFDATSGGTAIVSYWDCGGPDEGTLTAGRTIGSETPPVVVKKTLSPVVDKIGTYYIEFATTNGVVFKGEGTFAALGQNDIIVEASGIPLEIDAATNFVLPLKPAPPCSFTREVLINPTSNGTSEVSTYVATTPPTTKGKLQYQKDIVEGEVSHTITATVVNPGKYNIATDTQNGASFKATGEFAAAGELPVEMIASGKPEVIGDFDYTTDTTPPNVVFTRATVGNDSSGGTSEISSYVCDSNGAGPGEGAMMKDVEILDGEVTQIVKVNVTTIGTYDITTDTVNGVYFYAKGSFDTVGTLQTITLKAKGTPTAATVDATGAAFTIATTPNCAFNRVILDKNSSGGTSNVTAYDCNGANGNTGNIIVNQKIVKSTTDITKTIKVTVGSEGTYYIRAAKNGVVFSAQGTFTEADKTNSPIDVVLKAQGMANVIATAATFSLDVVGPDPAVVLSCDFDREFLLNPSSNGTADVATYECTGEGTGGTGKIQATIPIIDETDITSDNYVSQTIIADVRELGTYNISITNDKSSDPAKIIESNIVFEASGTFTKLGKQPLVLKAKPTGTGAAPTYDLGIDDQSDIPTFTIKPVATSGPEYTYCSFRRLILNSATGGTSRIGEFQCGSASRTKGVLINGTIIPVAPAPGDVTHTIGTRVDLPGSYNLKTVNEKGVVFRASGVFTSTGANDVVFIATGTPTVTPPATAAKEFLTDVKYTIWPFLPPTAGCTDPTCVPIIPARPDESDAITTGAPLGCEFNRNIAEPVVITTQPVATQLCAGAAGPATMTVVAEGGVPLDFQWKKNGFNVVLSSRIEVVSDKFTSTISFKNPIAEDEGDYMCVVSNGSTRPTDVVKFTVNPLPTVAFDPDDLPKKKCIAAGTTTTFSLVAKVNNTVAGNDYKINWYSGADVLLVTKPSGDTYVTGEIAADAAATTFKIEGLNSTTGCVSLLTDRKSTTVQATASPALPTNTNQQYCGTTTVTLTPLVTGANVEGRWYNLDTDTTPRPDGTFTVTAANPAVPLTVFLTAYNTLSKCESAKIPIVLTAYVAPTGVTLNSPTTHVSCGPAGFALNATAVDGGANAKVRWYLGTNTSPESGGVVGSGINFSTGTLAENISTVAGNKTYEFSVDSFNPDTNCAFTGTKPKVIITIKKLPTITAAPTATFCVKTTGTATATAGNEGNKVRWYETTVSTPAIFTSDTGAALDITSLNLAAGSHTLYVTGYNSASTNECESTTRTPLVIDVKDSPNPPIPTQTLFARCAHVSGSGAINLAVADGGTTKQVSWYDVDSGGTALGPPSNIYSPNISATKDFYVEVKDTGTNCISSTVHGRILIKAVWSAAPATPTVTNGHRCGAGSVTLSATCATAGATINWWSLAVGGVDKGQNTASVDTGTISSETKLYAEAWLKEAGGVAAGCPSFTRGEAVATINAVPAIPVASTQTPAYVCGTGKAKLTVTAVTGISMYWYNAAGTQLTATPSNEYNLTTDISSNTSFFVEARSATCNSSTRGEVVAKRAAKPTVSLTAPATDCQGKAFSVSIGGSAGTTKIRQYTAATGGTPTDRTPVPYSHTGSFTAAAQSTYWTAYDGTTGCESASRTTLTIPIGKVVPTISFTQAITGCSDKTFSVPITTANATHIYWNNEDGSRARTEVLTSITWTGPYANKIYDVYSYNSTTGCNSLPSRATITGHAAPTISFNQTITGCSGKSFSELITTANATHIYWNNEDGSRARTEVLTSITWTGPYANKIYDVYSYNNTTGCTSPPKRATITVNPLPTINAFEQSPYACQGTSFTQVFTVGNGAAVKYYTPGTTANPANGTTHPLTWTVNSVTATHDWEWTAFNSTTNCESAPRRLTLRPIAIPTITGSTPRSICGSGNVTVSATASAGAVVHWYNSAGSYLNLSGNDLTQSIGGTTNYFAEARTTTTPVCTSALPRTQVTATSIAVPGTPTLAVNASACAGSPLGQAMKATPASGCSLAWFTAAGAFIGVAATYQPSISTTTNYLVKSRTTGTPACDSAGTLTVTGTIYALPVAPTVPNSRNCVLSGSVTVKFGSVGAKPSNTVTAWSTTSTTPSIPPSVTGDTWSSPAIPLNGTGTYYAWNFINDPGGAQCFSPMTTFTGTVNQMDRPRTTTNGTVNVPLTVGGCVPFAAYNVFTLCTGIPGQEGAVLHVFTADAYGNGTFTPTTSSGSNRRMVDINNTTCGKDQGCFYVN